MHVKVNREPLPLNIDTNKVIAGQPTAVDEGSANLQVSSGNHGQSLHNMNIDVSQAIAGCETSSDVAMSEGIIEEALSASLPPSISLGQVPSAPRISAPVVDLVSLSDMTMGPVVTDEPLSALLITTMSPL